MERVLLAAAECDVVGAEPGDDLDALGQVLQLLRPRLPALLRWLGHPRAADGIREHAHMTSILKFELILCACFVSVTASIISTTVRLTEKQIQFSQPSGCMSFMNDS